MTSPTKRQRTEDELSFTFQLRMLGFCGVDDSIEPKLLAAISGQHDWVEWGVLFRPDKAGLPRYASEDWLAQLGSVNAARTMHLAGHLCSSRVNELLRGDTDFVRRMNKDVGFTRFQINATKANGTDMSLFDTAERASTCVACLRAAFAAVPEVEFIVQRNSETRPLWELLLESAPPNMSMLFDDSMGLGVSTTTWPSPPSKELAFGYAGGLSPSNLKDQLQRIDQTAPGRKLWVDMESSLRTVLKDDTDIFDANKAMACVRCVCELGLEPR
mmetsp:Transcript_14883/g.38417  ORF Transcript_14883/g.38417 Transcript_14883/m.38417 type:complete len:272 (+) Transcript_14883:52-867(+)